MNFRNSAGRDSEIDLESGRREMIDEEGGGDDDGTGDIGQAKNMAWSGFDGSNRNEEDTGGFDGSNRNEEDTGDTLFEKGDDLSDGRFDEEEMVDLLDKKLRAERSRKKASRKPSKPPRPPRASSLDSTDHKLVQEMSDLATLKRARMERMKALKIMKNNKGSSSGSNLCALVVTILFCLVIIWQAHVGFICEMEYILLEMDRILRPEGSVILRDDVDVLVKVKSIADGMRWNSQIVDHEDGPLEREKLLLLVKTYWTASEENQDQSDGNA